MDVFNFGITKIVTFLLVLARVGGIFTAGPVFGNTNVTMPVRVTIAVCLALVFLPMAHYDASHLDYLPFVLVVIKETLVGVLMGFLASLMFTAIQMAGVYIDLQVGFGFAAVVDPMSKQQNAVLGQLYEHGRYSSFPGNERASYMIRGLADSFTVLPLGQMQLSPESSGTMISAFASIFMAALKIGAPIVGAIFLTDLSLGILARTVPQLNVFVIGFPAKMAVALVIVIAVLPVAFGVMTGLFSGLYGDIMSLLRQLAV